MYLKNNIKSTPEIISLFEIIENDIYYEGVEEEKIKAENRLKELGII